MGSHGYTAKYYHGEWLMINLRGKKPKLFRVETSIGSNILFSNGEHYDEAYVTRATPADLNHHLSKIEKLIYGI